MKTNSIEVTTREGGYFIFSHSISILEIILLLEHLKTKQVSLHGVILTPHKHILVFTFAEKAVRFTG